MPTAAANPPTEEDPSNPTASRMPHHVSNSCKITVSSPQLQAKS